MIEPRPFPERKRVKDALRALGLSNRQTDALLRAGWRALVSEAQADNDELRDKLEELEARLRA